jgi:hypothetical protein
MKSLPEIVLILFASAAEEGSINSYEEPLPGLANTGSINAPTLIF